MSELNSNRLDVRKLKNMFEVHVQVVLSDMDVLEAYEFLHVEL